MQHLDEGTIHAWLDDELPADEAERMAAHASECPECGALVAEARGLIAASTRLLTALDDVPAGVTSSGSVASAKTAGAKGPIVRRHWYDRTDLRAAAALLFVAGASLVAVRIARNPRSLMKAVATQADSAAVVVPLLQDSGTPAAAEVPQQNKPSKVKSLSRGASAFAEQGRSEGRIAASRPTVSSKIAAREPASAPVMANATGAVNASKAMDAVRSDAPALAQSSSQLEEVVVTGGATATSASAISLRVLKVESTGTSRQVVYQVSPGVEVTLVESPITVAVPEESRVNQQKKETTQDSVALQGRVSGAMVRAMAKTDRAAAPAPMVMSASARPQINTISWSDLTRRYTLSGPLKTSELEAIKGQLMKLGR